MLLLGEKTKSSRRIKVKPGLGLYGLLQEGMGFKEYLHGPMDVGTKLKVKFRTWDIGLQERGRRCRTVVDEDDNFTCNCGWECEDRVHVVAECSKRTWLSWGK